MPATSKEVYERLPMDEIDAEVEKGADRERTE